jgi:hypothetical protein
LASAGAAADNGSAAAKIVALQKMDSRTEVLIVLTSFRGNLIRVFGDGSPRIGKLKSRIAVMEN